MPKKRRQTNNINAKGRSKYDDNQYLMLTYKMIKSPQFRSLNGNDVRVLLEICSRHNGFNNGRIPAGLQDLADTLMMGKSTADRCLRQLQKTKFIVMHKKGQFMGRIASEWEVTFLQSEGHRPTNEWGQAKAINRKRRAIPKTVEEDFLEDIKKMQQEEN